MRPLEETDAVRARQIYERAGMLADMYDFNLENRASWPPTSMDIGALSLACSLWLPIMYRSPTKILNFMPRMHVLETSTPREPVASPGLENAFGRIVILTVLVPPHMVTT